MRINRRRTSPMTYIVVQHSRGPAKGCGSEVCVRVWAEVSSYNQSLYYRAHWTLAYNCTRNHGPSNLGGSETVYLKVLSEEC